MIGSRNTAFQRTGGRNAGQTGPKCAICLIALLIMLSSHYALTPALAQSFNFSAAVNNRSPRVGEPFRYTVTVRGSGNLPRPQLGAMPDFEQRGSSTSQNISFVNGQVSSSIAYVFTLVPRQEGDFTLPPATLSVNGTTYQTESIAISVGASPPSQPVPPGRQPQPAASDADHSEVKVWFQIVPAKREVYLGEPVPLSVLIYSNTPLAGYSLEPALPQGFWIEEADLPEQPEVERTTIHGEEYYSVLVRRLILFPTRTGDITIPAQHGVIQYYVRKQQRSPLANFFRDSFFNDPFLRNPFFDRAVTVREEKESVSAAPTITVRPLPPSGRPPEFSGAVGRFRITAEVDDEHAVRAGEGCSLRVRISGQGNLKGIVFNGPHDLPGLNVFDATSSATFSADRNSFSSAKTFAYVVIPLSQGTYTIPALPFTFFDPRRREYRTIQTEPITLTALPGHGRVNPAGQVNAAQVVSGQQRDIIDIHPVNGPGITAVNGTPRFLLLLNLLPPAAFLGLLLYRRHHHLIASGGNYSRTYLSRGVARRYLKRAERTLRRNGDQHQFYLEIQQALARFIGHKFALAPQAVQPDTLATTLAGCLDEEPLAHCRELLDTCHLARYSPSTITREQQQADLRRASKLIGKLNRS